MATTFTRPQDYILESIELSNYKGDVVNLVGAFITFQYTESIFEPYGSGTIVVFEQDDIAQFFPLVGEEKLSIKYTTDGTQGKGVIEKIFSVYRKESKSTGDVQSHVLYFVSPEAMVDQNVLVSKSFPKKQVNEIVERIYNNYIESDKEFIIEPTKGLHSIVVPNWSPFQTISWCASFAQHPSYTGGTYMFFENNDGFNFKPLELLIESEPIDEYSASVQNLSDSDRDTIIDSNSVQNIRELSGTSDTLNSLSEGMYANRYIAYDNIAKTIRVKDYDYLEQFDDTKHLNPFKLCTDNFTYKSVAQRTSILPTLTFREESDYFKAAQGLSYSPRLEETANYKTSLLSQISSRQFEAIFNGDLRITCGVTLNMEMPNESVLENKSGQSNRFNSRKFLVASCTHSFTAKRYSIVARLVSDSLPNEAIYNLR